MKAKDCLPILQEGVSSEFGNNDIATKPYSRFVIFLKRPAKKDESGILTLGDRCDNFPVIFKYYVEKVFNNMPLPKLAWQLYFCSRRGIIGLQI